MLHIPGLFMASSEGKGYGMFTAHDLTEGDIIEICTYILIPAHQLAAIHQTVLHDYYFLMPEDDGTACLLLGYGSLYNHSSNANVEVIFDVPNGRVELEAIRDIQAGEELLIDYTGGLKKEDVLWFEEL